MNLQIKSEVGTTEAQAATQTREDKTRREQAKITSNLLAAIVESSDDAIVGKDLSGIVTSWNKGAEKIFGYASEEMIGTSIRRLIPADRLEEEDEILGKITQGEIVLHFETLRQTKDGRLIDVSVTASPINDEGGKIIGVSKMARDITRQKQENSLRESEEKFRQLAEAVPQIVWITQLDGATIYFNQQWMDYTGLTLEESLGHGWNKPFHAEDQQRAWDAWQHATATVGTYSLECRLRRADGVYRWWLIRGVPMRDVAGNPLKWFGTCTDIHDLKQAELLRQRMEIQLRQSQKLESIGQLAAGIAHEINTPSQYVGDNTRFVKESFEAILGVLQSHEELLAAARSGTVTPELLARIEQLIATSDLQYLCEQIPEALNAILEGVERVSKIVRAMKEFSHPGGKEKSPADLNKAIESTTTVARNEWKYVADLKLELEPSLPLVPCFLGEFNQAMLNLIVNAAHAIGDVVANKPGGKGLITVQTRREGEHVEVRVTDTGSGIPEAAQSKIFEPFFTTKGVGKGTGQGLAMIYGSIVNNHGGTVTFETETGKGATFIIRLPTEANVGTKT